MNKVELIEKIVEKTKHSKAEAARVLEAVLESITETLANEEDIILVGFGTFLVKKRAARMGRNVKTGEAIQIPAKTVPAFKAGKSLKEAVNK